MKSFLTFNLFTIVGLIGIGACNHRAPVRDEARPLAAATPEINSSPSAAATQIGIGNDLIPAESVEQAATVKPEPKLKVMRARHVRVAKLGKSPVRGYLRQAKLNRAEWNKSTLESPVRPGKPDRRRMIVRKTNLENTSAVENLTGARHEGSKARTRADAPGASLRPVQAR